MKKNQLEMIIFTHIILFLLSFFTINKLYASEHLVLGTGLNPPLVFQGEQDGFLEALIKKAINRIGKSVEIITLPAERVLINANNGVEDGCVLRIKGLEKVYPNLIRVPEMMMFSEFVGYTTIQHEIKGGDWQHLAPHSVAYLTGWKIFDMNLATHKDVITLSKPDQLFSMLNMGRVEIVLYERWQGLYLSRIQKIKNIRMITPPFAKFEMFMYLNKRYKALVPMLASALASLKEDGTYKNLMDKMLRTQTSDFSTNE